MTNKELESEIKELRAQLEALKGQSNPGTGERGGSRETPRTRVFIAVVSALTTAVLFGGVKVVADAIKPGYFIEVLGGVSSKQLEQGVTRVRTERLEIGDWALHPQSEGLAVDLVPLTKFMFKRNATLQQDIK